MNSACDETQEMVPVERLAGIVAGVDVDLRLRARASLCELRLGHVGTDVHGPKIGDLVERLSGLHDLAGLRICDEHGAGARDS